MSIAQDNYPISEGMSCIIEQKGIKQTYVATNAGFSPKELSDMLNGRRLIRACDIPKLAHALGVTPNELFGYPDEVSENSRANPLSGGRR